MWVECLSSVGLFRWSSRLSISSLEMHYSNYCSEVRIELSRLSSLITFYSRTLIDPIILSRSSLSGLATTALLSFIYCKSVASNGARATSFAAKLRLLCVACMAAKASSCFLIFDISFVRWLDDAPLVDSVYAFVIVVVVVVPSCYYSVGLYSCSDYACSAFLFDSVSRS